MHVLVSSPPLVHLQQDFIIINIEDLPTDLWTQFVEQHPEGNIFHTPQMFKVFERAKYLSPIGFAAFDETRTKLLALLIGIQTRILGAFLPLLTSRIVVFGGWLAEKSDAGHQALGNLMAVFDRVTRKHSLFCEVRNMSDANRVKDLAEQYGYVFEQHLNYEIDLTKGEEELWNTIGKGCRGNIKKTRNKGVVIREVTDEFELNIFYNLVKNTYNKVKIPLADFSLFLEAFHVLRPSQNVIFLLLFSGNTPVGARAALLFRNRIFDWYAGENSERIKGIYSGEALVWELIQRGCRAGFSIFDFGGAGNPDEPYGVRDFKAKFNGALTAYGRFKKIYHPFLYGKSLSVYKALRSFL